VQAYQNFVGNVFVDEVSSPIHNVVDPSTGATVATVQLASVDLVTSAVNSAKQAHSIWQQFTLQQILTSCLRGWCYEFHTGQPDFGILKC
jgi:acyl-CoA reductase-like NAD-dependent aldehyde dehydrogenase